VDPLTLRPGDRFMQVHRFVLPPGAPAGPTRWKWGSTTRWTGNAGRCWMPRANPPPTASHFRLRRANRKRPLGRSLLVARPAET